METINLKINESIKSYDIIIGSSTISKIKDQIKHEKIVVIMDFTIKNLYEKKIMDELKKFNPILISILSGESSKSRTTKKEIEEILFKNNCGRDTILIAVGGGVIGDLVGYVASTYNRGIPYIQVPTTLLSMVDASIGGKTGINTSQGKNLIGSIWQPKAVIIDVNFLDTLPIDELLNGLVEAIKAGIILNESLFNYIENNSQKIIEKDSKTLLHIIKESVKIKSEVVAKDQRENNYREILNFGHTVGHAIENLSGYTLKHGFCVSIGIICEARISVNLKLLNKKDETKIITLLKKLKLPTKIPAQFNENDLINVMQLDKKTRNSIIRFVLIEKFGKVHSLKNNFSVEVSQKIIKKVIMECKNEIN